MKSRGKKRRGRRGRRAAERRAAAALAVGGLPLNVLIDEGLLRPATAPPVKRVRATAAERAHIDRLAANPDAWEKRPTQAAPNPVRRPPRNTPPGPVPATP